jgi:lipopolysaccharide transport system permease protein
MIWHRRALLAAFVRRDLKVVYAQTMLGPLWFLIQPAVTTAILAVTIARIARVPTDGAPAPLFYMVGTILWSYFAQTVNAISRTFITNEYLFGKVWFPRILVPLAGALSGLVGTAMQLAMLMLGLALFGGYRVELGQIYLLPLALPWLVAFSAGVGLVIASTTVRYRDVAAIVPFALQSGFLLTPIAFPFSMVSPQWRLAYAALDPLSVGSDLWRAAVLGLPVVSSPAESAAAAATSLAVLVAGVFLFQAGDHTAADTI